MNTAMPSATGVAMSKARIDEYSVPQMNGSAPNCPATGSQISVRQKFKPNFSIESIDWRELEPIAATMRTSEREAAGAHTETDVGPVLALSRPSALR